jgi:serine/threonine protein kinase
MENLDGNLQINKYNVIDYIGKGKFGWVYKGERQKTKELVAIKVEPPTYKILKHETMVLHYLQSNGCKHVPIVHWYGNTTSHTCLVMTLYEHSLYDLMRTNRIKPAHIYPLCASMIDILQSIHSKFVIHRDIKPHNFMYKGGELFLIDFGMANFYIKNENQHIEEIIDGTSIIGTPNYISVHIHNGITPSRRDDMISLGYIFLFLLEKSLPWENLPSGISEKTPSLPEIDINHPRNQVRLVLKSLDNISALFHSKYPDSAILQYFHYVYRLGFSETPRYSIIQNIFAQNNIK